jgi:autotransporter-associated beta strand protein
MQMKSGVGTGRTVMIALAVGGMALWSQAAWNGAGTAGGDPAATNINDTANWSGGIIDNSFVSIVSNVDLTLTSNHTTTNGFNLVDPDKVLRHITFSGTNTLTLDGLVPGYTSSYTRTLFLPSNTASTVTFKKGLKISISSGDRYFTGNGLLFADAQIIGAGSFISGYRGGQQPWIYLRNDTNTFSGRIDGDAGNLHFTSVADKSKPSAFGAGTSISVNNYTIVYVGARDSRSNRDLSLLNGGCTIRNDSACGGLDLTGSVYIGQWVNTDLFLDGISTGEALLAGVLKDYGYDTVLLKNLYTKLDKRHSGTWRLTGKNTFTGIPTSGTHIGLAGGTLIADYTNDVAGAGSNRVFAAGRNVAYSDAKLVIRGKTGAGNTTWQSFGTNTVADSTMNVLVIDGNGGDGTAVVWDTLAMSGGIGLLRVEKAGNASLVVTNAFSAASGTVRPVNGVLMAASGTRSDILVQDSDGRVGFASQDAALEIVRNPDTVALTADNGTASDHTALSSSLTRTAHLAVSTLTIDASANDVTLDMAGRTFQTNGNAVGRGVAVYGSHAVTVQGGAHGAQSSTFIHNYSTEKLTWALTNGTCAYVNAGPGLTEFTQGLAQNLYIAEGTARLTAARNYTEGLIYLFGNGVLEIGADLNGSTAGDFTRTSGSSPGQISFASGGGFSAYGADRTVNIGGASGTFNWHQDGKPLIFSSPSANATLIFQNPVSLSSRNREIRVQDGSADIDARLTGKIFGAAAAGVNKTGAGTLELTGRQEYWGAISVVSGGLKLGADTVFAGGTNALVLGNATLDAGVSANAFKSLELLSDSTLRLDAGAATLSFADCSDRIWTGTLNVDGKLGPTTLRFGTDANGLTPAQLVCLSKSGGGSLYLDQQGYLRQFPRGTLLLAY